MKAPIRGPVTPSTGSDPVGPGPVRDMITGLTDSEPRSGRARPRYPAGPPELGTVQPSFRGRVILNNVL
eukprot:743410-Hanusia_phi.AAC.1